MIPSFESSGDDELVLLCPGCKSINLHQGEVEIFDRSEDSVSGLHTTANVGDVKIDADMSKNPSSRRDGMRIHFTCEYCDAKAVLTIVQHKGSTLIAFED